MHSQPGGHKVVFLGDSGVGKTSLLRAMCGYSFKEQQGPTIGVDFMSRRVNVQHQNNSSEYKQLMLLWDTCGQERFRSIGVQFCRHAEAYFFVYDVTNAESFLNLSVWIREVSETMLAKDQGVVKVLLGNKSDSYRKIVTWDDGARFASEHGMHFLEVSAKCGLNVEPALQYVADLIAKNNKQAETPQQGDLLDSRDKAFMLDSPKRQKSRWAELKCCSIM